MQQIAAWFSSLSARERLLIQAAAALLFGVLAPFLIYRAADAFAERADRALTAAHALERDEKRLEELVAASATAAPAPPNASPRDLATATAQKAGLQISRIEPDGPTGVQVMFQPASALAVYRWIDGVEHSGLQVTRVVMVRAGEGDVVAAQVRAAPRVS